MAVDYSNWYIDPVGKTYEVKGRRFKVTKHGHWQTPVWRGVWLDTLEEGSVLESQIWGRQPVA